MQLQTVMSTTCKVLLSSSQTKDHVITRGNWPVGNQLLAISSFLKTQLEEDYILCCQSLHFYTPCIMVASKLYGNIALCDMTLGLQCTDPPKRYVTVLPRSWWSNLKVDCVFSWCFGEVLFLHLPRFNLDLPIIFKIESHFTVYLMLSLFLNINKTLTYSSIYPLWKFIYL